MRITAAVYKVLTPILNEMREDIISSINCDIVAIKNEIATMSQSVSNQTEEVNTRLSSLNESLRDDFRGVERELSSTASIIMAMKNEIGTLSNQTEEVNTRLSGLNESLRDDCEGEISSTENIIIMAMKKEIGTLSNQTEEVNTRLSGLNESLRDDFSGVERELSSTASIIMAMKNEIGTLRNQTEEVNTRLSGSLRDDFSGVERELCSTANMICDKIEEHDNHITTELMRMNQTLTEDNIINNSGGLKCGGTWGWRRAVYLDMTDPKTNCPSGWQLTEYSKRTCGRVSSSRRSCDSVFFPVSEGPYSQVCGRIRAYQWGLPNAFRTYIRGGLTTIDSAYVSGVAVMYGSPRQHIWTFANGAWENDTTRRDFNCPSDTAGVISIPPFVGEDYFCESGYVYPGYRNRSAEFILHSHDTLWDGRDCHFTSTCCSHQNSPYFTKTLNQTTTNDLELRMCLRDRSDEDNIAVELVELYVK